METPNPLARSMTRTLKIRYLLTCAFVCLAQDKHAVPESSPEPAQLQLEWLIAPDALATLVNQRRWDEVLNAVLRGLAEKPGDPILHYWAGVARFHQRDFVQAVLSLRSAEKLGLDTAPFHEALGVTYYAIRHYLGRYYEHDVNDYLKAISYFDKALERDPGDFKSLHFRAFCLQMLGREAEARVGYEAAIRRIEAGGAAFGWPYQKMAELLLPTDPHAAMQYAQKAVKLEPEVEASHLVVAKINESQGDFDAAILECLEAARLKPNDPAIRYVLMRLYKKEGDSAAAAEQLKLHEKLRAVYVSKQ